jgi:hypothetical protein
MKKQTHRKFKVVGTISDETQIFGTTYGKLKKIIEKEFKKLFGRQMSESARKDKSNKM